MKKKYSFKDRVRYAFDNMMSRGNGSMVKFLLFATLAIVIVLTLILVLSTPVEEREVGGSLWDILATTINAWMPYSEDGSLGYIITGAVAAVVGLLFTSVLIGIISTAMEEKISTLKEGRSIVLESGHIVVIGYTAGRLSLLSQLIQAAGQERTCIVVGSSSTKTEMEDDIRENLEIPKNVRVICRSIDPENPSSLSVLAIEDCSSVIIDEQDDVTTVKMVLAARNILKTNGKDTKIISRVSSVDMLIPSSIAKEMNVINIQMDDMIARIIAHSCTEPGLAKAYGSLFEMNDEIDVVVLPMNAEYRTFGDLLLRAKGGIPIGFLRDGRQYLNPGQDTELLKTDEIVWCKNPEEEVTYAENTVKVPSERPEFSEPKQVEQTFLWGRGQTLRTVISEFPENGGEVLLAGRKEEFDEETQAVIEERNDLSFRYVIGNLNDANTLQELIEGTEHIILLSDDEATDDDSDTINILRYAKIKRNLLKSGANVQVTLELKSENNLALVSDEKIDFIVTPHFVSMFLAQLSIHPENARVFKELLSNEGSELHMRPVGILGEKQEMTVAEARAMALSQQMVLLGLFNESGLCALTDAEKVISLSDVEKVIVMSEN